MSEKIYHVLFLCTGNSARSLMAEAALTVQGNGRFKAYSAGTRSGGLISPFALEQARTLGYPVENLRSKSWTEFTGPDSPEMDFIVIVCDVADQESHPIWPGSPIFANWIFEQPLTALGSIEAKRQVFARIQSHIQKRIALFVALPLESLDRQSIQREMNAIGDIPA